MKNRTGREAAVVSSQRLSAPGFSLFKLTAAIAVFSAIVATLLYGISYYQGEAEHAGMQLQLVNMRTALYSKALLAVLHSNPQAIAALSGANPVAWLERAPANYRGEIDDGADTLLTPGNWYFDRTRRNLVYVFTSKKSFPAEAFERRYFTVEFSCLPTTNAKPDGTPSQYGGVALIQVDGRFGR